MLENAPPHQFTYSLNVQKPKCFVQSVLHKKKYRDTITKDNSFAFPSDKIGYEAHTHTVTTFRIVVVEQAIDVDNDSTNN